VLAVPQVVSGEARGYGSEVQGTDKEGVVHAIVAEGTTEIGDSAFAGCSSLASVTIPGSVTAIGEYAFCHCSSLVSVTIPDSVRAIEHYAFHGCSSLASVSLPAATTLGQRAFPSTTVVTRRG
jgi:hypothetical protein